MGIEIERKFLVQGASWRQGAGLRITQGYLNRDPQRTVRLRIAGDKGFLTIKGPTTGVSRVEFEYPIDLLQVQQMLSLCDGPVLDKTRYAVTHLGDLWEVDEFHGANQGLVVAEIELTSPQQPFSRPDWLGAEVSDDPRYFNSSLISHPFCQW